MKELIRWPATKLTGPTVADVIAFLQTQRQDARFRVADSDSRLAFVPGAINTFEVWVENDGTVLFGPGDDNLMGSL